jgi:hypothetical protein
MFISIDNVTKYKMDKISPIGPSFQFLLALLLTASASFFCFTTLMTLKDYGIRVLYADQWRIYTDYFNNPFPANVLTLQNGHRPVISGLFFLLDRYLFGARQNFLLTFGAFLAISTAVIIVWPFLKNRFISLLNKSLAVYIIFTAIFWLGNSRVLFHGNESVHAYLVPFLFLMSHHSLLRCQQTPDETETLPSKEILWSLWACIFSLMALFSFGAGVAAPPTLVMMAFILRLSKTTKVIVMANIFLVAALYFLMPSAPKVAGVLSSSSPEIRGFTNFFSLLGAPLIFLFSGPEALFLPRSELFTNTICPIVGVLGIIILAWRAIDRFKIENRGIRMETTTALAMSLFSCIVVLLVAVMRSEYFSTHPDQLFANRYLIWTTLFWGSLGLEYLNFSRTTRNISIKRISTVLTVLVSLVFAIVIHSNNHRWLAHIEKWHNITNTAAVGLLIGIHDQQKVPQDLIASADHIFALSDILREEQLNIFSTPIAQSIRQNIQPSTSSKSSTSQKLSAKLTAERTFTDPINHTLSALVTIQADLPTEPPIGYILIADQTNKLVGATVLLSHQYGFDTMPQHKSFSGYIKDYNMTGNYHLYAMGQSGRPLPVTLLSARENTQ